MTNESSRSRSFRGQGQINICQWKGIVQRSVLFKYEVNTFTNKEFMDYVEVS